jgi:hypothetical protein
MNWIGNALNPETDAIVPHMLVISPQILTKNTLRP